MGNAVKSQNSTPKKSNLQMFLFTFVNSVIFLRHSIPVHCRIYRCFSLLHSDLDMIDFNTVNANCPRRMYFLIHPRDGLMMREWPYTASSRDALGCTIPTTKGTLFKHKSGHYGVMKSIYRYGSVRE